MKKNTWDCSKKEVTKEDVGQFIGEAYDIVKKMFVDRFGTDVDGDIPVDFHFVNRVVFEPLHFFCIPYFHLLKTTKEKLERLYDMFANLSILQGRLDTDLRILKTDREFDKAISGETEEDTDEENKRTLGERMSGDGVSSSKYFIDMRGWFDSIEDIDEYRKRYPEANGEVYTLDGYLVNEDLLRAEENKEKKSKMTILDWFDPTSIKHLKAYKHLNDTGRWPRDFLPEDIEFPSVWSVQLHIIIINAYLKEKLGG